MTKKITKAKKALTSQKSPNSNTSNTSKISKIVLPIILKNALDYGGSVNPKAVLGLTLRSNPELKKDIPALNKEISELATKVQALSPDQIKIKLTKLAPNLLKQQKTTKEKVLGPLKNLKNATPKNFSVRIAPSPSGPLHIGHAYGALLNHTYANMYQGKFFLRIEDTNPANIYPLAYKMIESDVNWLTNNGIDKIIVQSDRLEIYYTHLQKLIDDNNAYVCTCDAKVFKELKDDKTACPCRKITVAKNKSRLEKMLNKNAKGAFKEGSAVIRIKTDIEDKNPAMRDFAIFRINETTHPKTKNKYRLWPLMVFSVAIDDYLLGITHVLNGKDHHDNGIKEAKIMALLGWKAPTYNHWGRINFEGFKLSTTKTRQAIENKEYSAWDDIRLATLLALKRRGYKPAALRKFAIKIGLSLNDKTVLKEEFWKMLDAFNKEIVDKTANRYFAIIDPVQVNIHGMAEHKVKLAKHPDYEKRGWRELTVGPNLLIAKQDFENLKEGRVHRLIDCCNFEILNKKLMFHSEEFEDFKNTANRGKIIHYLPTKNNLPIKINLAEGKMVDALAEKGLGDCNVDDIVQLERQFFARVDKITKSKKQPKSTIKTINLWQLHS